MNHIHTTHTGLLLRKFHLGSVLSMAALLGVMLVLAVCVERVSVMRPDTLASVARSVIVEKTNENRARHLQGSVHVDPLLQIAAQRKAEDMATKGYFAHVSPDGITPWYWFDMVGYSFRYAGENLAVRFSDSDAVVRAWMQSEGHRANILNANFTDIGIGIAKGVYKGKTTLFVVQLFGTPHITLEDAPLVRVSSSEYIAARDLSTQSVAGVMSAYTPIKGQETEAELKRNDTPTLFERASVSPEQTFSWMFLVMAGTLFLVFVWFVFIERRGRVSVHGPLAIANVALLCLISALLVQYLVFPEMLIM